MTKPRVQRHRLSRRSFLTDFGAGTAAVAVFGLAGCSRSDSSALSVSTTSSVSEARPTTTAPTPSSEPGSTSTPTNAGSLVWQRVELGFVSAYVIARGSELAVVDTGAPGSEGEILRAVMALGGSWNDVQHVILTHAHGDHIGSVNEVLGNAPQAMGYAGTADLAKISSVRDLAGVEDGDEVFGLQVIGTPGHTAGHISVFDEQSGLLLAGDAMNSQAGRILGANPNFSDDMEVAAQSIKRMATRTVDTVLFGHGDPVVEDAQAALEELAASL